MTEYFPTGGDPVYINPPNVGDSLEFGTSDNFFTDAEDDNGNTGFSLGELDIDLQINALARKSGSDLMSAPKVTVLSGKRATIVVGQELRYPRAYNDIESTVSSGGGDEGSAAVSITAGTPQDFTVENIGVNMAVKPTVGNDNTISLYLEPEVRV